MANTYDVGDVVRLSNVVEQGGAAMDPTTLTLIVKLPDATETTYTYAGATITRDSAGNYHVDVSVTMPGKHRYRWTSTGTGQASEEDWFEVRSRRVP